MKLLYRISPEKAGYKKDKPSYINNYNCLKNALDIFLDKVDEFVIFSDNKYLIDNPSDKESIEEYSKITELLVDYSCEKLVFEDINCGNGACSFRHALSYALNNYQDEDIVYFLENDYLHLPNSYEAIVDGLQYYDMISLYNHPDKFMYGVNPHVNKDNTYTTFLRQGKYCHFYQVDSTTMTFASKVSTLKKYLPIISKHTSGTHPNDYDMFKEMKLKLATPVETFSTHGETFYLSKFVNWETTINQ